MEPTSGHGQTNWNSTNQEQSTTPFLEPTEGMPEMVAAPLHDMGQPILAPPLNEAVQTVPSLLLREEVQLIATKKVKVEYEGFVIGQVSVTKAVKFLEWTGHMDPYLRIQPGDGPWIEMLALWLSCVLHYLHNPDMVAALFARSCDSCRARKGRCERKRDGKCLACQGKGLICLSEKPMKKRGRPSKQELAAREAAKQRTSEVEEQISWGSAAVADPMAWSGLLYTLDGSTYPYQSGPATFQPF
ncbi:hypothetical protein OBBRIDRAFT_69998 [Obba rivulosa]|uniref:Zn(2)-C6 fungal-type domain-containing protein n=1 Tax=Obba rivulosa TaxID=1052685 RepID=A0A8E2AQQ1_9APHY|nr:hypothetical protein OBBRIDRAFT_69998 [Obba rivulosa]